MSVMNQFKICLLGQDNLEEMEPNVAQATKKVNGKHALSDTKTNKPEHQDEDALYEGFHKCLTFDQCLETFDECLISLTDRAKRKDR